jgi:hypothetical protein
VSFKTVSPEGVTPIRLESQSVQQVCSRLAKLLKAQIAEIQAKISVEFAHSQQQNLRWHLALCLRNGAYRGIAVYTDESLHCDTGELSHALSRTSELHGLYSSDVTLTLATREVGDMCRFHFARRYRTWSLFPL